MNLDNIWQEFLKIVNEEAGSRVVETWFKAVTFWQWDTSLKTVYLKAPNNFVKDWVTSKYQNLFNLHLSRLLNENNIKVLFVDDIKSEIQVKPAISLENNFSNNTNQELNIVPKLEKRNSLTVQKNCKVHINQSYKFDTFVVGPNNSLAYAAAQAVAERPGVLYNPLFIYGGSGLGKTHLLHAVGNQIKTHHSQKFKILYQSADRFVNEFINAIRFDKISFFESKYRDVDCLLIDDIQFISNKEQTQEAFFHIFNALYESRKQIVFTSDTLPKDISGLADRLRSRLDGGLIADIQIPTLETKVAILKRKSDMHGEFLSDEVAHYIAEQVSSNVRELEGLFIRVLAFSSLTHQDISLELAQKVLARNLRDDASKSHSLDLNKIATKVAKFYDYNLSDLRSSKRIKNLTLSRHVAMYYMKKLTDKPLSDIASFFNRKDHSTVIHALEKIEQLKSNDQNFCQELKRIENSIL